MYAQTTRWRHSSGYPHCGGKLFTLSGCVWELGELNRFIFGIICMCLSGVWSLLFCFFVNHGLLLKSLDLYRVIFDNSTNNCAQTIPVPRTKRQTQTRAHTRVHTHTHTGTLAKKRKHTHIHAQTHARTRTSAVLPAQ